MNKKQKWQKILALVMAVVLLPALLCGCGRRSSSRRNQDTPRRRTNHSASTTMETQTPATIPPSPTVPPRSTQPSEPQQNTQQEPLIYSDSRVPHYVATDPQWKTLRFDWECQDRMGTAWMELTLDVQMYNHYHALSRYHGVENYYKYINEANNAQVVRQVVEALRDVAKALHYDDAAVAREMAKFVQDCIAYEYDSDTTGQDEFPRYPIETLYERRGDCEDTSILMAALLKEWGYQVGFLHLPGHVAVALRTSDDYSDGSYYEINGHRYLYIESTGSGWNIGEIPEDCRNVQAEFHLIP